MNDFIFVTNGRESSTYFILYTLLAVYDNVRCIATSKTWKIFCRNWTKNSYNINK